MENPFNNYEVHPCILIEVRNGIEILEQCDEDNPNIHLWSVYGHYKEELAQENGCLKCLYDFSRKDLAEICCESLNSNMVIK